MSYDGLPVQSSDILWCYTREGDNLQASLGLELGNITDMFQIFT